MVSVGSVTKKLGLMPDLDEKTIKGVTLMKGGPKWAPQYWTTLTVACRITFP